MCGGANVVVDAVVLAVWAILLSAGYHEDRARAAVMSAGDGSCSMVVDDHARRPWMTGSLVGVQHWKAWARAAVLLLLSAMVGTGFGQ
ncbi:hypothetical protein EE082_27710 [Klebsiella pneumoniae]|nr:hypothetical protein [Klebsiella pneumoniae]